MLKESLITILENLTNRLKTGSNEITVEECEEIDSDLGLVGGYYLSHFKIKEDYSKKHVDKKKDINLKMIEGWGIINETIHK